MTRLALLALAITLPVAASAQKTPPKTDDAGAAAVLPDTLRPGDLDLSGLPEGEVTYTVRLIAPMQQDIGTIVESTALDGATLTRSSTVSVPMAGQNETANATLDAGTYAFRTIEMTGATTAGSLRLENGRIVGERQAADPLNQSGQQPGQLPDPVPVDDAMEGPVFGSGWAFAIVRALPLAEGSVHHVQTYSGRDGLVTERVTVLAEESIKPNGGDPMMLVPVETFDGEDTMTYYVDPQTRNVELVRFSPQAGVEVEFDRD